MNVKSFFYRVLFGGGVFFDLCKWSVFFIVMAVLVTRFWVSLFIVSGASMEPNLHDKELVMLSLSIYNKSDPKRGDIVVVKYPGDPLHKKYVKRVIALPGEVITIKDSKVYINNKLYEEDYLSVSVQTNMGGEWNLKDQEFFLMGDNRGNSNDSRYFGPAEKRFITGKATRLVYPRFRDL